MTTLIDQIRKDREAGTDGPWKMETVRTSCGTCHKVGPFPPASENLRSLKRYTHACFYDDYPPGVGHPHLIANARRTARVPDMEAALLAAEELADVCERDGHCIRLTDAIERALIAYREATK